MADSRYRMTALMIATKRRHHDVIRLLLCDKSDINKQNSEGKTAIFYSAAQGDWEGVNLLIQAGANLTLETVNGQTPRSAAEAGGWYEVVKLLDQHLEKQPMTKSTFYSNKTSPTFFTIHEPNPNNPDNPDNHEPTIEQIKGPQAP